MYLYLDVVLFILRVVLFILRGRIIYLRCTIYLNHVDEAHILNSNNDWK